MCRAGTGDNVICTSGGSDIVNGGTGDNIVVAGEGSDEIDLGNGADLVLGGPGDSIMTTNGNDDLIITGTGDDSVFCGDGAMDGTADAGGSNSFFDCELQDLGQSAVCVWKHVNASGFPGPAPFTFTLDGPVQKIESTADGKAAESFFLGLPGGTYTLSESVNHTYTPFIDCVDVTPPILEEGVPRTFGSVTNTFAIGGSDNTPHPFDDNPHCVVYNVGPLVTLTPTATPTITETPATEYRDPELVVTPSTTVTPSATPSATSFAEAPGAPAGYRRSRP